MSTIDPVLLLCRGSVDKNRNQRKLKEHNVLLPESKSSEVRYIVPFRLLLDPSKLRSTLWSAIADRRCHCFDATWRHQVVHMKAVVRCQSRWTCIFTDGCREMPIKFACECVHADGQEQNASASRYYCRPSVSLSYLFNQCHNQYNGERSVERDGITMCGTFIFCCCNSSHVLWCVRSVEGRLLRWWHCLVQKAINGRKERTMHIYAITTAHERKPRGWLFDCGEGEKLAFVQTNSGVSVLAGDRSVRCWMTSDIRSSLRSCFNLTPTRTLSVVLSDALISYNSTLHPSQWKTTTR